MIVFPNCIYNFFVIGTGRPSMVLLSKILGNISPLVWSVFVKRLDFVCDYKVHKSVVLFQCLLRWPTKEEKLLWYSEMTKNWVAIARALNLKCDLIFPHCRWFYMNCLVLKAAFHAWRKLYFFKSKYSFEMTSWVVNYSELLLPTGISFISCWTSRFSQ